MRELSRGTCLLQPQDYRRMPWKNGLGMTTELAVFPVGAGLNGRPFDWRVSLAEIETSCEFSLFPGYDRSILLSEGAGMELSFDQAPRARLEKPYSSLRFSGDWRTDCSLLNGPVKDFNVMTARQRVSHDCEILTQPGGQIGWQADDEMLIIHCLAGRSLLEGVGIQRLELQAQHTLSLSAAENGSNDLRLKVAAMTADAALAIVRIHGC